MPAPKKKMITAKSQVRTVTQSQSGAGVDRSVGIVPVFSL